MGSSDVIHSLTTLALCDYRPLFFPDNLLEALTMVAVQVMGNDAAIGFAGSQGNFELNVFKPVMIFNYLHSVELLADSCNSLVSHCVQGIEANHTQIEHYVHYTLMPVT